MRVIFFGTSAFAVPSLRQLAASRHHVVLCVTQPDRPQGRGLSPQPSPVKQAALELGLSVLQPDRLQTEPLAELGAEVGVVAAYGQLIRKDVLEVPTHGMIGVHPSMLPRSRGAAPIAWALLNGERTTGVTIFSLSEQLDAGEVLCQQAVAIEAEEDAETLTNRLATLGAELLVRTLDLMVKGTVQGTPQDETQASFAPKLTKAQGRIDWTQPAVVIERLVRATTPWPGATTEWRGKPLRVWRASVVASSRSASSAPGTVANVSTETVSVVTGDGLLELREVQPAGRRRMSIKDFLAGHPVTEGQRFGSHVTHDT